MLAAFSSRKSRFCFTRYHRTKTETAMAIAFANPNQSRTKIERTIRPELKRKPIIKAGMHFGQTERGVCRTLHVNVVVFHLKCCSVSHLESQPATSLAMIPSEILYSMN